MYPYIDTQIFFGTEKIHSMIWFHYSNSALILFNFDKPDLFAILLSSFLILHVEGLPWLA